MEKFDAWDVVERNFSQARLHNYLMWADGSKQEALHLLIWNTELSGAFWESLGHLEVALRNAIDRQMTIRQESLGRSGHWIFDDARELGRDRGSGLRRHTQPYANIDEAIRRVRLNHKAIDPGQVISEISFGFWHQMVSKNQMLFWPDLAAAFPNMRGRSQRVVSDKVKSLRALRNRIGHHHKIWTEDPQTQFDELVTLAGFIDADIAIWIQKTSRVPRLISQHPSA